MPDPTQRPDPNPMLSGAAGGGADWNQWARDTANAAINQGNNNPFSQMAGNYMGQQLSGSMANNPFMSTLYGTLQGSSMDEANQYLRDFLGPSGQGGGGGGNSGNSPRWVIATGPRPGSGGGGGGGGTSGSRPPDTVGNSDSFFAQKVKELFDAKRLDPANDPTMQPFIEAMRRENQENTLSNLADINARMEGAGRFGGSLYAALDRGAREEGIESLDSAMSQAMLQSREAALQRQMEGLGQVNTRDIAAMNDATQRYGIDSSAAAAGAGAAAAAEAQANAQKLQAIQMMMQGSQFGLGLMGDMANTMSANQLGVMNAGLGYGQLGQMGYQNAGNIANVGLQGLGLQGGIGQDIMHLNSAEEIARRQAQAQEAAAQAEAERWRWQQGMQESQAQQDALDSYLNILLGIGGAGGDVYSESPGQYVDPGLGNAAPWMAGIGSVANNWSGISNLFNSGSGGGGGGYTPSASSRGGGDFYFEP